MCVCVCVCVCVNESLLSCVCVCVCVCVYPSAQGGPVRSGSVGPGPAQQLVECPKEMVGRVIGRGGETIKVGAVRVGTRLTHELESRTVSNS